MVLHAQSAPQSLQLVKFVEADVEKCKALASELLRQTSGTPNQGQAVPLSPHVTVAPDAADFVNGQAWGIHDVQKNEDIEYGRGASCVLERQYMQFNQLGSAEKERSPLRCAQCRVHGCCAWLYVCAIQLLMCLFLSLVFCWHQAHQLTSCP